MEYRYIIWISYTQITVPYRTEIFHPKWFSVADAQMNDRRDTLYMAGIDACHTATVSLHTSALWSGEMGYCCERRVPDGKQTWWSLTYVTGYTVLLLTNSPPIKHQHRPTSTLNTSFFRKRQALVLRCGKRGKNRTIEQGVAVDSFHTICPVLTFFAKLTFRRLMSTTVDVPHR